MTVELTPEGIREFVIAAHFDLDKVKSMLAEHPGLLAARHQWGENDFEDGLGAASHVGNRPIAEFFLAQAIPLTMCAAAMLGRQDEVAAFLKADPTQANARGAHQIPVLFHAAMSGDTEIANLLKTNGCAEGYNFALHGAISHAHVDMARWLLDNGATDIQVHNHEGKSPLQKAQELNQPEIADLLRQRGAVE